jgi:hypothetical protein
LLAFYAPVFTRPLQGLYVEPIADDSTEMEFIPSMSINNRNFENVVHVHYFRGPNRGEDVYMKSECRHHQALSSIAWAFTGISSWSAGMCRGKKFETQKWDCVPLPELKPQICGDSFRSHLTE